MSQEAKLKHLDLIQAVINRMANSSFLLKGWSVTLSAALFALVAKDADQWFIILPLGPIVMFWGLDGYFLRQERLFRKLYDTVRTIEKDSIDFSMDTSAFEDDVDSWFSVVLSKTLAWFHGIIFLVTVIIAVSMLGCF